MTIRQVELIRKKEFALAALDPEHKVFVVHVAALSIDLGNKMHLSKRAQIAYLKANEAPIKVLSNYADFVNIFLSKLATELSKHTKINNHTIKLVDD